MTKKPQPSSIDAFRGVVWSELHRVEAWIEYHRQDGRPANESLLRQQQIWQDLLTLLAKLEVCRPEIKKLFAKKKPQFDALGFDPPPVVLQPAESDHAEDGQSA